MINNVSKRVTARFERSPSRYPLIPTPENRAVTRLTCENTPKMFEQLYDQKLSGHPKGDRGDRYSICSPFVGDHCYFALTRAQRNNQQSGHPGHPERLIRKPETN